MADGSLPYFYPTASHATPANELTDAQTTGRTGTAPNGSVVDILRQRISDPETHDLLGGVASALAGASGANYTAALAALGSVTGAVRDRLPSVFDADLGLRTHVENPQATVTALTPSGLALYSAQASGNGYLANRWVPAKQAVVYTATASGDTTILSPASGRALGIYWVSAQGDPTSSNPPLVNVSLGATGIYRAFAIGHAEYLIGAVDAALIVNLSQAGTVPVTAHYLEV